MLHRTLLVGLTAALALAGSGPAQFPAPLSPAPAQDVGTEPLPGARPGTQRWIVHLRERDLGRPALRAAILAGRPAAEVERIVAELEARAGASTLGLTRAVEALGGAVLARWWLIDACAVELPPAALDQLRALPEVAGLEPDVLCVPAIGASTGALNHNAVAVHAQGLRGEGTTIAILDTGADADMNGSGRPHRVFFVDGDPSNPTGGGIGGSRLSVNQQVGALAPEDINGHGTTVAAVAAGGAWGTVGAAHGHAYGARIASFSIADNANGNASSTSMVNGWQAVAAQRQALGITVANNSYGGEVLNSAFDAIQRALDSAAFNADLLVTVPSGNQADGRTGQSGCNALVAAAVVPDTHRVASWSGRGPLPSDPARQWPDISAVGVWVRTPALDCENSNWLSGGTSFAAPQVAGAAALLRAAVPGLRAEETKAILLASTLDIADRNPLPPSNTRNAYGMGLLRDDVAVTAALHSPQRHGIAQVDNSSPRIQISVALAGGVEHGIAITWMRKSMHHVNWSNLDLRILDGTTEVAASTTPRNLYEMVRFRPTQAGVYTIQVDAVSIDGVAQDFAYAVAEGLAVAPIAAIYESFGQGCAGSGSTGVDGPACAGPNRNAATFAYEGMAEQHEFAMQEISPPGQPTVIGGISMLLAARPGPAVSVTFGIRLAGTDFRPAEPPVATTTVVVGSTPGWWGANFARPVTIPPSTRYFVTIESGPLASFAPVPAAPSREGRALFSRSRCSTWGSPSTVVTSYRVHCASPSASVAIPLLSANGLPSPGGQMAVELAHARPGAAAVLLTGFSNSAWGAASLPFDLGGLGAPGCQLLVAPEVADGLVAGSAGTASRAFALPNQPGLLGGQFYQQYAVLDPVNPLGLVTSNGGQARVGR